MNWNTDGEAVLTPYNLAKYEKAFALLGTNYQFQIPEVTRQVLVFIALNLDFENNDNQAALLNLFGAGALDRDTKNVLNTLREIKTLCGKCDEETERELDDLEDCRRADDEFIDEQRKVNAVADPSEYEDGSGCDSCHPFRCNCEPFGSGNPRR
jgi:hypothetical protein